MKNKITTIITYAILCFLVFYVTIAIFLPTKSINIFGFRTFIIVSSSMEPDIGVHDLIVITTPKEENLEVGDVITFDAYIIELQDYSYVTHYIAAIEEVDGETIYKTQGAGKEPDDYDEWTDHNGDDVNITFDDIEGEYQFTIPLIGQLVYRLQDPIFVALLVVNGVVIYYAFKTIKSYIKEDKQKES